MTPCLSVSKRGNNFLASGEPVDPLPRSIDFDSPVVPELKKVVPPGLATTVEVV